MCICTGTSCRGCLVGRRSPNTVSGREGGWEFFRTEAFTLKDAPHDGDTAMLFLPEGQVAITPEMRTPKYLAKVDTLRRVCVGFIRGESFSAKVEVGRNHLLIVTPFANRNIIQGLEELGHLPHLEIAEQQNLLEKRVEYVAREKEGFLPEEVERFWVQFTNNHGAGYVADTVTLTRAVMLMPKWRWPLVILKRMFGAGHPKNPYRVQRQRLQHARFMGHTTPYGTGVGIGFGPYVGAVGGVWP